ncbi:MAG: glycosyl transferase family 2, partial [Betaproteobacteria bacterium]|nr:glycosyl transferase family 2 [Betaproteobacteria bacterium]
ILLGTFQGEQFLAQQLDSIEAQTHTDWALWASDDGSTDGTVRILKAYQARWGNDRLAIGSGPAQGFRANFLSLACNAAIRTDYFAFCDQDDLWDRDKLAAAVAWLDSMPINGPALYCARTRLIDENNREIGFSPLFPKPPVFENAIVQSIAGGNTMVFNAAARSLLFAAGADVILKAHDWWTYILVSGCGGTVFYDAKPRVGYRQHGGNQIGSNGSWAGRYRRFRRILIGEFRKMNDRNIAALERVADRLSPRSRRVLDEMSRSRDDRLIPRMLGIRRSGVYCQTVLSSVALVAATVLKKL